MKSKMIAVLAAVTTVLVLSSSTAFAWKYALTGTGACQPNGTFLITWTVDNTTENEPLHITGSSSPAVVPVGTNVSANSVKTFTQSVSGTKNGKFSLTLKGNWISDELIRSRTATVVLETACQQPTQQPPVEQPPVVTPPVNGGLGGGNVTPPVTTTTPTPVTPAPAPVVPVGPVSAGEGGASSQLNLVALTGLVASMAAVVAGVRRRVQKA